MDYKKICGLCREPRKLSASHIIPRAFFRAAKKGSRGQLMWLDTSNASRPRLENADWKEPLFCGACEQFISINYEKNQIELLRDFKYSWRNGNKLTKYKNYDFEKFYIFWLSILWRAALARNPPFEDIEFTDDLVEAMRLLILSQTTIHDGNCFSQYFQIGIVKAELLGTMLDINKVVTSFKHTVDETGNLFTIYIEGYLVNYFLPRDERFLLNSLLGPIKRSSFLKIKVVNERNSKQFFDLLMAMRLSAS